MVAPFGMLLVAIALSPLFLAGWWGRHSPKIALGLAAIALGYYLIFVSVGSHVWHTTTDYFSFICLVGSLFVISGGIHINVKAEAPPRVSVLFLLPGELSLGGKPQSIKHMKSHHWLFNRTKVACLVNRAADQVDDLPARELLRPRNENREVISGKCAEIVNLRSYW